MFKFRYFLLLALLISPAARSEEKLKVYGSSAMYPIAKKVSQLFYRKTRIEIQVKGGSSSRGLKLALSEKDLNPKSRGFAIGMIDRDLTGEHTEQGLVASPIAYDSIVIVVNVQNPVQNISSAQIFNILTGETSTWDQLGGPNEPILCLSPRLVRAAKKNLLDILKPNITFTKQAQDAVKCSGNKTYRQLFLDVQQNTSAIGWSSLANYHNSVIKNKRFRVRALSIDGVKPTLILSRNGQYPLTRTLNFVTFGKPTGLAKRFINFTLSNEAQKIIQHLNYIPLR